MCAILYDNYITSEICVPISSARCGLFKFNRNDNVSKVDPSTDFLAGISLASPIANTMLHIGALMK